MTLQGNQEDGAFSRKFAIKKKLLVIAGPLAVGVLGSALWEGALKPLALLLGSLLLDIATLGLKGLRDDMYQDIARGLTERASVLMLSFVVGAVFGAAGAVTGYRRGRRDAMRFTAEGTTPKFVNWFYWLGVSIFAAMAFLLLVQVSRTTYVIKATAHLEQLQRIAGPALTPDQRLIFNSRAAQIATREDFIALTDELKTAASRIGAKVPSFEPY